MTGSLGQTFSSTSSTNCGSGIYGQSSNLPLSATDPPSQRVLTTRFWIVLCVYQILLEVLEALLGDQLEIWTGEEKDGVFSPWPHLLAIDWPQCKGFYSSEDGMRTFGCRLTGSVI